MKLFTVDFNVECVALLGFLIVAREALVEIVRASVPTLCFPTCHCWYDDIVALHNSQYVHHQDTPITAGDWLLEIRKQLVSTQAVF
jgi:hypothetical protein